MLRANADLIGAITPAKPTGEQYSLFRAYLDARHPDGGMADMSVLDYSMMIEDSHIDTVDDRIPPRGPDTASTAAAQGRWSPRASPTGSPTAFRSSIRFTTPMSRARSAPTSFSTISTRRGALGLPHVYLGYWVEGSRKMAYKGAYLPQERLGMNGWVRYDAD